VEFERQLQLWQQLSMSPIATPELELPHDSTNILMTTTAKLELRCRPWEGGGEAGHAGEGRPLRRRLPHSSPPPRTTPTQARAFAEIWDRGLLHTTTTYDWSSAQPQPQLELHPTLAQQIEHHRCRSGYPEEGKIGFCRARCGRLGRPRERR
jgi:hypothetical protein